MRKIVGIVLGLIVSVACIAGAMIALSMPSTAVAENAPSRKIRIGVSVPSADHGWTAGISWWSKRAMALYPDIEWTFAAAKTPEEQVAQIEDMMNKRVDGLVILATESAPLTDVAVRAHEAGIHIVNVDRGFLKPAADIFIEGDNKSFGRKSGEFMARKLNGKGNILILEGIPCTVNTDRVQAFMEVLKRYPDIKVLARQPAMWNRETAVQVTQNLLTQFPRVDAIWVGDDDAALGALQAIKEAGRQNDLWMFPGAGMKDVVKMVMDKNPMFPADITYPPSMIATGIQMSVSVLRDGQRKQVSQFMPRHLMIDVELITPENAKDYYFPDSVY